jgi:hypothetical protein
VTRPLLLTVYALVISLLGVASIKISVVYLVQLFYGVAYEWSRQDAKGILVYGLLLGGVMCAFVFAACLGMGRRS